MNVVLQGSLPLDNQAFVGAEELQLLGGELWEELLVLEATANDRIELIELGETLSDLPLETVTRNADVDEVVAVRPKSRHDLVASDSNEHSEGPPWAGRRGMRQR